MARQGPVAFFTLVALSTSLVAVGLASDAKSKAQERPLVTTPVAAAATPGTAPASATPAPAAPAPAAPATPAPSAAPVVSASPDHATMDHTSPANLAEVAKHDAAMAARTKEFPAKTEGVGGQLLKPKVLPDGTKVFSLTTSITKWEVEKGKFVDAMTYNGTVPGPTIKVDVGDKVRIVLTNKLATSTSIHFHGIRTPNTQDGVPDITQPPVQPGKTFTYAFTTTEPAVGMYHSHHDAQIQVPGGLAAAFLVGDMPLPKGIKADQEHTMMLNDAGLIGYSLNGKSFPATAPYSAKKGESLLFHYLNEGTQIHPMHLHGFAQLVVAKDGYPVPMPYKADTINVAPGERYSVLVTPDIAGVWAWHCHVLPHAERADGMFGMVTALIVK